MTLIVRSFLQALIVLLFDREEFITDSSTEYLPEVERIHYILEIMHILLTECTSSTIEALSAPVSLDENQLTSLVQTSKTHCLALDEGKTNEEPGFSLAY